MMGLWDFDSRVLREFCLRGGELEIQLWRFFLRKKCAIFSIFRNSERDLNVVLYMTLFLEGMKSVIK